MAQEYNNKGPIYTTTQKYEAMRTAGTLEVGREYRIVDDKPVLDVEVDGTSVVDENNVAQIDITGKQDKTDSNLQTTDKTVVGAINELNTGKQAVLTAGDNIVIKNNVISSPNKAFNYINQVADYLFEVEYSTDNVDYDYANKYFKSKPPVAQTAGACTGVVKDGKVLRQLDWYYDNKVEFIVRRPSDPENGIHASIGVASGIQDLTKDFVESGVYTEKYKMVPFIITDGINDAGLYIQSNVVPGISFDINPTASEECCMTMVARYILDHCATFAEVETFFNTAHIYGTSAVNDYTYHFLLALGNAWEVIELTSSGHQVVTQGTGTNQMPNGIVTNFRTTGLTFTDNALDWSSVESYGEGVERYDLATKLFTNETTLDTLRSDLIYTNLYTNTQANTRWNTDYCSEEDNLTVMDAKNTPSKFDTVFAEGVTNYQARTREDGKDTWQTVHSAIYDLSKKSFNIWIQERTTETFDFELNTDYATRTWVNDTKQNILTQGNGISISNDTVAVKYDDDSIKLDSEGKLYSYRSEVMWWTS